MFSNLARFVLGHRLVVALVLSIVMLSATAGAFRIEADFSAMAFFGGGDPAVDRLVEFKERWGQDDAIILVVVTAEPDAPSDLLTGPRLRAIQDLVERLEADRGVAAVHALTTTALLRGDPGVIDVAPLAERLPDGDDLGELRERILADDLLVPSFVSATGEAASIAVELDVDPDNIGELRPAVIALREVIATWSGERGQGLVLATAGIPAVRTDFFQLILADQVTNVPILMIVLFLLMLVIFRRMHGALAPGVAALVPAMMVFGVMGWLGEPIGILNQSYFTLLPVIAVADAIHMVSRFHEEVRRRTEPGAVPSPEIRKAAIRTAMSAIGGACFLTSLTTAVGFASLSAASMPILRGFGLFAALGIVFAYGTVLLLIPLMLSLSRGSVPEAGRAAQLTPVDRLLLACAEISIQRPAAVLLVFGLVLASALWFGRLVVVDNTLTGLISPDHETSVAGRLADAELGGILGAEVDLSGPPGCMKEPETLRALERVTAWAHEQPEVRAVVGPSSWLSSLTEALTGTRKIPNTRAGVAQMMLLAEGDPRLDQMLSTDRDRARLTVRTRDDGGNAFESFANRLQATVDTELADTGVTGMVTGTPYVAYRGINGVTSDLRDSLIVAFIAITIIIAVLFRSIRIALLALLPNAMPLVVGYGLMGLMGWELDPTPAVVFTIALGIAVDDTIHLVVRIQEERAAGRGLHEAIRQAVLHSGRAVMVTTVLLCIGFGLNAISSFPSMQILGILGAVVIGVALLGDLFLLPALLVAAGDTKKEALT